MVHPVCVDLAEAQRRKFAQFEQQRLFLWFCYHLTPTVKILDECFQEVLAICEDLEDDEINARLCVLKERFHLMFGIINEKVNEAKKVNEANVIV